MNKLINWFQIPAKDLDRATKFYGAVLNATFHHMENETGRHAFFALKRDVGDPTGGEIVQSAFNQPAVAGGVTIFLNAPEGIAVAIGAVKKAGGKVVMPQTAIGAMGVIAIIVDSEGNAIGLHSMQA